MQPCWRLMPTGYCRRLTWRTADRSVPFGTKMRKNQIGIRGLSPVPVGHLTLPPEDSSGGTERNRILGSPRREPREYASWIKTRFPSACASGFEAGTIAGRRCGSFLRGQVEIENVSLGLHLCR